ncbi:sulfotransferase family 2 domain-containing protein [Pseudotabrizicola alkalilacus]|nr:sulfotransferase family 2 domain-containing protein [Pseudotabrizicola alkalilacus]
MISHSRKFIFIHIPKTAGTSIEKCLTDVCVPVLAGANNTESIYFKHTDIMGFKRMLGDYFLDHLSFTSVRNPWDWLISLYEFNRGMQRVYLKNTGHVAVGAEIPDELKDTPFDEWLIWWTETFRATQSKLICDPDGQLLVQRILAYESIRDDFSSLISQLNLPQRNLPWFHKRDKKGPRGHYFSPRLRGFVEKNFSEDIERFGYAFDDPPNHVPETLRRLDASWRSRAKQG